VTVKPTYAIKGRESASITKLNDMIKRLVLLLFAAATLAVGVTACHTVHGAGEDISTAGNKIQENTSP
jgi:predicted small secreted protein